MTLNLIGPSTPRQGGKKANTGERTDRRRSCPAARACRATARSREIAQIAGGGELVRAARANGGSCRCDHEREGTRALREWPQELLTLATLRCGLAPLRKFEEVIVEGYTHLGQWICDENRAEQVVVGSCGC